MPNTLKPLLIALVLLGLPVAAQYRPSFSSVREVTSIHVNKDGSSVTLMEVQRKIETQQGIEMLGEQRITYNSTLENVEVLEAYTLLADGTRVNVEPDKIRTQDDVDADGSNIYSDSKVTLNGNTLHVWRDFVRNRKTVICSDKDDRDWERFSGELKRDLRQQVFFSSNR